MRFLTVSLAVFVSLVTSSAVAEEAVDFQRDVRPIISNHCFACHGPDEKHREADVRLDVADEVDLDEMLARITSTDPDEMMPPPDLKKPLNAKQITTLKKWIEQDAPYEQHWAYSPAMNHAIPETKITTWSNQAIDRFVLANLEKQDLKPKSKAEKRTLIRRVTLDLTGLPPTSEQIRSFLNDESKDAYEKLVNRLLDSPAYGEHMARYWLDLVRFADTNGLHHDHYREMTPYRDWVIRAFNDNLPMDDFIKYQLAGDLYEDPTVDQQIASGFNRLHLIIDRGTALPEESHFRNVVDQVSAVGTAFMGLTMQCAVCHDHKYDPITQKDFYQLSAFFNNFDGAPETGGRGSLPFKRGLQEPYIELPTPEQKAELDRLNSEITKLDSDIKEIQAKQKSKKDNDKEAAAKLAEQLKTLNTNVNEQKKARDSLLLEIPATLVMKERADVRPAHIMIRGAYDQPGEEVSRNVPGFLPPMKNEEGLKTRMDLAKWFVDPSNPLSARVAVNRFWQQMFGVGLVKTSEDFGAQGEAPSHPKLLDHLATRFVESGWDVKAIIRSIVLSETYQQSSKSTKDQYESDPDNRLLARGSRFRLDAEVVRDQMLAVSGMLNTELYGKSVKPPQPAGLWKIVAMPSSYPNVFTPDTGDKIYRRSLYTFWKRGLPPPQMTIFDAPTRESCIARRERTNTPLQALLLMNEEQHFAAATHFAKSLIEQSGSDDEKILSAYETITSQMPDEGRVSQLRNARQEFNELYSNNPDIAKAMITASKEPKIAAITDPKKQAELASWTMIVHSLLNLDITKTRE